VSHLMFRSQLNAFAQSQATEESSEALSLSVSIQAASILPPKPTTSKNLLHNHWQPVPGSVHISSNTRAVDSGDWRTSPWVHNPGTV
jgi:hypothetical protein